MAGKSDYLENELLDHIFKTGAYTVPTNIYVALCTSAPTDADDGSDLAAKECDYTSYARTVCNTWDAAASGATENTGAITFPKDTGGDADVVTHFAIMDNNVGDDTDHMLYWGALSEQKTVSLNDTPEFAAGAIDITED